jgi:hypothetical protein
VISAELTKSASPTVYSAVGQIIVYQYSIKNTGSAVICFPIEICDDQLGSQFIRSMIMPGETKTFTRTYTITQADLSKTSITNTAQAFIHVKCKKLVCTNSSSATINIAGADLSGIITQEILDINTFLVRVTVVINNSSFSAIPAQNVSLVMNNPFGVISTSNPGSIAPATPPVLNPTNVTISEASIPIGASYVYTFDYNAAGPGGYTWSGTITSTSFDPNTSNNFLTNTIVLP